jgi:hypothetical protein
VGIVLTILALVLAACPAILAFALSVDPRSDEPGRALQSVLGVSCCVLGGLLLPGLFLLLVGRPRKL